MNNNRINKYFFVLGASIIVIYLAINTEHNPESSIDTYETTNQNFNQIDENDFSQTDKNDTVLDIISSDESSDNVLSEELNDIDKEEDYTISETVEEKLIFINNIKIAQNIDMDKESESYREPINAYKTITTLNTDVIKEINYYPLLYVWTSMNTENISLNNPIDNKIEPVQLVMTIKCNDHIVKQVDYQINAKTPRWREWVEIDLSQFETESIMGLWNVEIYNKKNQEVIESRNFKFYKNLELEEVKQTAEIIE
tara:strand:+ start:72 stop:836 length:765 start_codon:yes stop_codon:yes gene_type:complete